MKLTWEEIKDIANRLDEIIGDNFHDAMWNTISERDVDYDFEVSDEDILLIKEQLKRILLKDICQGLLDLRHLTK